MRCWRPLTWTLLYERSFWILDSGFALRENPVQPPKVLSQAVYFQRPECRQASMVMPFALTSELLPFLAETIKPGFARRFFYLDKSWEEAPSRLAMFFERGKNEFFGPFRKQHFFTGGMVAILVAEPVDCNRIDSIDWRQVWDKERHRIAADHASAPLRVRNQG
jgi:hypothetical protein